jgi:putative hydrolase of HD superfamily
MDAISRYIFEAGMLKRVKRSGWWAEGVNNPESVADHSFRTAIIAFMLARMEGVDETGANRLCTAAVFHDMQECRIGDLHKIAARYIHVSEELGRKVEKEQAADLPLIVKNSVLGTLELDENERVILKDADYLECAFQAKEYADSGYAGAKTWIGSIARRLKTKSAKMLIGKIRKMDSNSWWKGLKRLD